MLQEQPRKRTFGLGLLTGLLLVALAGATAHCFFGFSNDFHSAHAWGTDDAYISYRYAGNLANGNGLVYNPGDKVEGYSNFLYVVLVAGLIKLLPVDVYSLSVGVNLLAYGLTFVLFAWYVKRISSSIEAFLACLVIALCPLMWLWPASGLETSVVLLVQLAIFIVTDIASRNPSARLLALLCCLTGVSLLLRADGFVFSLICSGIFLLRARYRIFAMLAAFILAFMGVQMAVRYSYYGSILPNTFYAKVCGSLRNRVVAATRQLWGMSLHHAFLLYLAPLLLGWKAFVVSLCRDRKLNLSLAPTIPFVAAGLLAYWIYVGGDHFQERFLVVLIPLSIIHLASHPVVVHLASPRWKTAFVSLILIAQFTPFFLDPRFAYQSTKYDMWIELGKYLSARHPDVTLAIDAAGKTPFVTGFATIDMLGLNDAHIGRMPPAMSYFLAGHNKFDPVYVMSRRPDMIAAWNWGDGLDLGWGITREKYSANGYVLKYLVNGSSTGKETNILDVEGLDDQTITNLRSQGYKYFVVVRADKMQADGAATASTRQGAQRR